MFIKAAIILCVTEYDSKGHIICTQIVFSGLQSPRCHVVKSIMY